MPDVDIFRVLRAEKQVRGEQRRKTAEAMFEEAKAIVEKAGLTLLKHTPAHYSLRGQGWQINIYPGNRRLHTLDGVFLDVNANWTLLDVARSAARKMAAPVNRWNNEREARIRSLAYQLWEEAGKPPGDGQQFWLEAEKRI